MTRKKISVVHVLLIGTLVVGLGLIGWALKNIRVQSAQSNQLTQSTQPIHRISIQSDTTVKTLEPLYPVYPSVGEKIGTLTIPALEREITIVEGTGDEELKLGVGHFSESVLPGMNDNSVLSGHRDTVFTKLDKLEVGDQLIVATSAGTFTYEISGTRIVDKDDKTVIVPTDHAVLTLTTCYPFSFIGNAPERYIITADLVTVMQKNNDIDY